MDCIEVTKELEKDLTIINKLVYEQSENRKGYAWKLESIEKIDNISSLGQLGIWNYYTPKEIMNLMNNIKYGWLDKNNNRYNKVDENFSKMYILQSPKNIIDSKIGVCFDQVELERFYFKNSGYKVTTYFICHYDHKKYPSHSFIVYNIDNKYYWFEHSWPQFKGIHEYISIKELLTDVRNKFIKYELNNKYQEKDLLLREFSKPKYNISVKEYYKHCEKENIITIKEGVKNE